MLFAATATAAGACTCRRRETVIAGSGRAGSRLQNCAAAMRGFEVGVAASKSCGMYIPPVVTVLACHFRSLESAES